MATKSVVINGVSYTNVPSIEIPLATGTGNAEFYEISDSSLASAGQLLNGVTAYKADGTKVTGNIASKSSSDLTASGATVTVPAGHYAEAATKSVASGSATTPATTISVTPTITVNTTTGKITATVSGTQSVTPTVSAGYVASGTAGTITVSGSDDEQLTVKGATTYTPGTTAQTIAAGTYLTGAQTIAGDSNLNAAYIKSGVSIFGVTGTLTSAAVSQDSTTKVLTIS